MLISTKKALLRISTTLISLSVIQACQATPAPEVVLTSPVTSQVLHQGDAGNGLKGWDNLLAANLPKPTANQAVHIIKVATLPEASQYQLQVQIGLNIMQDCNQHRLMGELQKIPLAFDANQTKNTVQGTAHYYLLESLMQAPMVTLPCIEAKKATFVQLGETLLIASDEFSENVFYLPQDAQLRYRLWRADETWQYSPSAENNPTSE
jgi:ecotin